MGAISPERRAPDAVLGSRLRAISFLRPPAAPEPPGSVSPELALVDPDLRSRLITGLFEPGAFAPRPRALRAGVLTDTVEPVEPVEPVDEPQPRAMLPDAADDRVSRLNVPRLSRQATVVAVATVCAALGLMVGRELEFGRGSTTAGRPSPPTVRDTETQAPSTNTSPPAPRSNPRPTAPVSTGRAFAWPPAERATGYEVQFFRGARRVHSSRVVAPRITLPPTWRHRGRQERLTPGTYRWYVWPLRGDRRTRDEHPIVQATFDVMSS